ncbi:hypothetical protein [Sorangium sp. So ce1078]|uniref:hypothetical protein n=1 Tax=Sorangium sp. So ce1078 TaxID=3133329 RepID=UPI003F6328D7
MDDAVRNISAFDPGTLAAFQQINVHSYAGSQRKELRQLAAELGKRLWHPAPSCELLRAGSPYAGAPRVEWAAWAGARQPGWVANES